MTTPSKRMAASRAAMVAARRSRAFLKAGLLCASGALAISACSLLGTGPTDPEGLPHGGIGLFRLLTGEELNVPPSPSGSAILLRNFAVDGAMVAERHLFYAGGRELAEHGDPDPMLPAGEVDWALFEARGIFRAAPRESQTEVGFDAGPSILSASEAWEGGFLRDPWCLVLPDGRALLYYAAEGGIGLAMASSVDGTFTRAGSAPIIASGGAGVTRRPSVVPAAGLEGAPAPFFMFFERDGQIIQARSDDATSWTELGALDLPPMPPRDDRDSEEVAVGGPGALMVETPAERGTLRLYYESRRADGQVFLTMAGSFDGLTFEPLGRPVLDRNDVSLPAPRMIDDRITVLYARGPRMRGLETGAILAAVAPGNITLMP